MGRKHNILTVSFTDSKVTHAATAHGKVNTDRLPWEGHDGRLHVMSITIKTACGIVRDFKILEDGCDHDVQGTWDDVTCKRCQHTKRKRGI